MTMLEELAVMLRERTLSPYEVQERFSIETVAEARGLRARAFELLRQGIDHLVEDWESTTKIPPEHRFTPENLYTYESNNVETVGNYGKQNIRHR